MSKSTRPSSLKKPSVVIQTLAPPPGSSNLHGPTHRAPLPFEAPQAASSGPPVIPSMFAVYWSKVGGGSFVSSLLIHVGILVAAYFIVETIVQEQKVDFLPGGGSKEAQAAAQQLAHQVQNKKRSNLNRQIPLRKVVSNSISTAIALPDVPMDTIDMPEMSSMLGGGMGSSGFSGAGAGGGFGKGIGLAGQNGFVSLPPSMKSRCSAAERLQKLKESGGSAECERAVSTALEYFKSQQNEDGSWGANHKAAMTGFALLCYLGRCETPDSPFYGENVTKGIMYLVELAKKNPEGVFSETPEINSATYEHGIATYALGEMYTMARMGGKSFPGMRDAFENGVKTIIKYQLPDGGWRYSKEDEQGGKVSYSKDGRGDPSVTGWQYQALKAAKLTGLKLDGLHTAIDRTVKYFDGIQTREGGFGLPDREKPYNQWTMTGVGTLAMQTIATGKSVSAKKGVKWAYEFFQKEPPEWENANLYTWYYYAQIFFQNGGVESQFWNQKALPLILKGQDKSGAWKKGGPGGHDIYPTALCTLMLEVYYRYLKVGDKPQGSIFDAGQHK